jgi:hypothetical protein
MALTVIALSFAGSGTGYGIDSNDKPLILGVAVALSTFTNLDSSPRSRIGLCSLAYRGMVYLQDAIANQGLAVKPWSSLLLAGCS